MKNHTILKKKENYDYQQNNNNNNNNKQKKKKRLKEEIENYKDELLDHLLDGETKISESLTDLKYGKEDTLHDITILESKLKKLEITSTQIDKIKKSILSS